MEVDGQGDLLLRVADKELRMRKPVVYQEKDGVKQEIAANTRSRVSARSVSRSRLTTRPGRWSLIPYWFIRPFSAVAGQERGGDRGQRARPAFVTGFTTSPDFPTEPQDAKFGPRRQHSPLLTKFNIAGNHLIYSTYLGGSNNENYSGLMRSGPLMGALLSIQATTPTSPD